MYTEERAKRMAKSKHYYQTANQEDLDKLDKKILSRPRELTDDEIKLAADRLRKLKNTGCIKCGIGSDGKETFIKTSIVKRKTIQRW